MCTSNKASFQLGDAWNEPDKADATPAPVTATIDAAPASTGSTGNNPWGTPDLQPTYDKTSTAPLLQLPQGAPGAPALAQTRDSPLPLALPSTAGGGNSSASLEVNAAKIEQLRQQYQQYRSQWLQSYKSGGV